MHWRKVDKPIASIWRVHCQQLLLTEQYIGKCPCYTLFLKLMIFVDLIKHGVVTLVGDAAHYKIDCCYYYLASSVLFSMCVCVCVGVCVCVHACIFVCVCVCALYVYMYTSFYISLFHAVYVHTVWGHRTDRTEYQCCQCIIVNPHGSMPVICDTHGSYAPPMPLSEQKKPTSTGVLPPWKEEHKRVIIILFLIKFSWLFSHQSSFLRCDQGGFDLPCICLQARWGDSYHTQFRSVMPGPMLYMCHQPSAVNAFCLWIHHCHCSAEFAGTLMQPKSGSTGSSPHPQNVVSSTSTRQLTNVLTCE